MVKEKQALLIQKTLRGRLVQAEIQSGIDRRDDLIDELRIKYEFENGGLGVKAVAGNPLRSKISLGAEETDKAVEIVITAEYLGKLFDYYTKQLTILREERRIAAETKLAERTRKLKEAEERGRRQEELSRREFENNLFAEIMGVNDETIDSYLQDIIEDSTDANAEIKAHKSIEAYAKEVDAWVTDLEQR
jgi:hypothetical protein